MLSSREETPKTAFASPSVYAFETLSLYAHSADETSKRRASGAVAIENIQQVAVDADITPSQAERPQLVLDIGTHKVLGLAIHARENEIHVLASCMMPHPARAMRDGQIHDVPAVAKTLRKVVSDLETAVNVSFTEAYIAAAGRALRTARGKASETYPHPALFTEESHRLLEWEAVANAQTRLLEALPAEEQARGYYCIAHSRIGSWLDGEPMGSLIGQRGWEFTIEVLATFLPGTVVDSLEAVLTEAGLEMRGLTLEPIAALEAVMPPTMRHLNLTLVDIGAGTSDIAFTGDGTVRAFAMVPQAGDAVTEAVSRAFLLDFAVAEQVKRAVASGEVVRVENVLGEVIEVDSQSLRQAIEPTTNALADRIVEEMAAWSAEAPEAVLLVGGGSMTPGLAECLAERLELPSNRVAVRDRRAVRGVVGEEKLEGPDAVTALGIALRCAQGDTMPPVRVRVNGRPVCLFLPDRCTVREAARIVGMPMEEIVGRMGPGITITVNGEVEIIPGSRGKSSEVRVNGMPASLDTNLNNLDVVELTPPTPGSPPKLAVRDIVARWLERHVGGNETGRRPRVRIAGEWRDMPVWVRRNGRPAREDDAVQDRDVYEIRFPRTAAELLEAAGIPEPSVIRCWVNGRPVRLQAGGKWFCNGHPAGLADVVRDGDVWDWRSGEPPTVAEMLKQLPLDAEASVRIVLNGEAVSVRVPAEVRRNGNQAALDERVRDGDRFHVAPAEALSLYQILPYAGVNWDPTADSRRLTLLVRGKPAGFTTPVYDGDEVIVRYE